LINQDFSDMLSALSEEGVEYLLVGAYALAVHGHPRATGDIDIWVRPTPENAGRVLRAVARFGAPLRDLSAADLSTPGTVFQIGVPPRRIDLMTSIDAVEFAAAWTGRLQARVGDRDVPVIGKSDLVRNKRATGRPQDLADVAALGG
jgi:hypothetical protein